MFYFSRSKIRQDIIINVWVHPNNHTGGNFRLINTAPRVKTGIILRQI